MAVTRILFLVVAGAAAVCEVGCSKAPKLPTVPVSGVVTYNGTPLANAQVAFIPKGGGEAKNANGLTDAEGKFTLQTFIGGSTQASGAIPGDYIVTVSKYEALPFNESFASQGMDPVKSSLQQPTGNSEREPGGPSMGSPEMTPPKLLVPEKFASPNESPFSVTVKASGNEPVTLQLAD